MKLQIDPDAVQIFAPFSVQEPGGSYVKIFIDKRFEQPGDRFLLSALRNQMLWLGCLRSNKDSPVGSFTSFFVGIRGKRNGAYILNADNLEGGIVLLKINGDMSLEFQEYRED